MDHAGLLQTISQDLTPLIEPEFRQLVHDRYKMNVDRFWGVRTPNIHKVADAHYRQIKAAGIDPILAACGSLLATGIFEHKMVAFRWAARCKSAYREEHGELFSAWLYQYVDDWNDCDDLCTHVIGQLFVRYPAQAARTRDWATSPQTWPRRAAAVALIPLARQGQALPLIVTIAQQLERDPEDLVLKGYGWLLKEASKQQPDAVFDYLQQRKATMPRLALRYAAEKLPEVQRKAVLQVEPGEM